MSVDEFEAILKQLPTLKAPGVSGSRIKRLTELAVKNVAEESKLMATLYSNCKAVPSTHKLGTLYVVDAIVRAYIEEAKRLEQTVDANAPEGTPAAAAYKLSELIESLMDDSLELCISPSTKVKIGKLVDIWERAETFSPEILARIRDKHFKSTTPPGTPPPPLVEVAPPVPKQEPLPPSASASASSAATNAPSQDSNSILSALASLSQSRENAATAAQPNAGGDASSILAQLSAFAGQQQPSAAQPQPSFQQQPQGNAESVLGVLQSLSSQQSSFQGSQGYSQPSSLPPIPVAASSQGYGNDRRVRSPPSYNRDRSPPRWGGDQGNQASPVPQPSSAYSDPLDDPAYCKAQFDAMQQARVRANDPSRPPRRGQGGQLLDEINVPGEPHYRPRNVGVDNSIPHGSFKVLSRTLFVGGVPRGMDENGLSEVLRPFAETQSIILNSERKHAFIKVYSRREAEQVITAFNKDGQLPLRTRWGVGFGPRDCCNYQHGVSVIPIDRLTEADRQWVVTAQWGGTGGSPLTSGMVIDEPDIEIGAGISSKAMSKKMPTNSARNGPKSNRPGEPDEDFAKATMMGQRGRGGGRHGGHMGHGGHGGHGGPPMGFNQPFPGPGAPPMVPGANPGNFQDFMKSFQGQQGGPGGPPNQQLANQLANLFQQPPQ